MVLSVLAAVLVWLLIGDLLSALRPWESEDPDYELWFRITWPVRVYWVFRSLIRDWRTELRQRNKHW